MPEIQNIGPIDYQQMPIQQAPVSMPEDVNDMPMVYNPATDERKSGSSLLGYTAAVLGTALVTYFATKHFNKKIGSEAMEELTQLKNSEAVKNYDKVKADYEGLKETTDKISDVVNKHRYWNPKTWGISKKIKALLKGENKTEKAAEDVAKDAKDKINEGVDKAAEDIKKAAEEKKELAGE